MQVTLGVCADYANVAREGKLNIMGIFDQILVRQFPAVLPAMKLVLRLEAHFAERDRSHRVEIQFREPDGPMMFQIQGELVPRGGAPGESLGMNQIIDFANLQIPKRGTYQFIVLIDGDQKREIPLRVMQIEPEQLQLPNGG